MSDGKKPAWGEDGAKGPKRWSKDARGDDPTKRNVLTPTRAGIGDGKSFSFLFGFKTARAIDQAMLARELEQIQDDVEVLRAHGYTVVVDPQATREDFLDVIRGQGEGVKGLAPAGIYWSAHGHPNGALECCDGGQVTPADVDAATVSASLRLVVLGACYVGAQSKAWRRALGGRPLVVGWGAPVTIDKAVEFLQANPDTETDLDDLIRRYLLSDAALPGEPGAAYSPLAAHKGKSADLASRVSQIAIMLGAKWRERPDAVELWIPLPEGRDHVVELFVVDASGAFVEGEPLLAAQAEVGAMSHVVDVATLLAGFSRPGFARIGLVKGDGDAARIVTQGFLPYRRTKDTDLAALAYEVALLGDELEKRIFVGQRRS